MKFKAQRAKFNNTVRDSLRMDLLRISINNLRRRKTKALVLAIGIFVAVVTTVTLFTVTIAMRENIDAQLDEFGTNLLLTPKYKETPLSYGGVSVSTVNSRPVRELTMSDVGRMRTIQVKDNLNVISPKLVGPVNVEGNTALIVGIQFENELRLKTWWQYRGKQPKGRQEAVAGKDLVSKRAVSATNYGPDELIVGDAFARKFKLEPGSKIILEGKTFKISSILKSTGSSDDNVAFGDLGSVQTLLQKPGKISFIEANAYCLDCPLDKIARQLQDKLPYSKVSALREAMAQKQETLALFEKFSLAASAVVVFIACFIVLVTVMASVKERTREIGIFRAVGFRKRHIAVIILAEAALISAIGGVTGYFAGFALSKVLVPVVAPQALGFYFNPNNINPTVLAMSAGASLLLGVAASLYPARKAASLDPASALRFI